VGDGGVGKTSMVLRYTENKFKENYIMTIGTNFGMKSIELPEKPEDKITLQIWDLAGQDQFQSVRPVFYQGAKAILYVFDLTRKSSLFNLFKWKEEVEEIVGSIPCILVGNKLDLVNFEKKKADKEEVDIVKSKLNAFCYLKQVLKRDLTLKMHSRNLRDVYLKMYTSLKIILNTNLLLSLLLECKKWSEKAQDLLYIG